MRARTGRCRVRHRGASKTHSRLQRRVSPSHPPHEQPKGELMRREGVGGRAMRCAALHTLIAALADLQCDHFARHLRCDDERHTPLRKQTQHTTNAVNVTAGAPNGRAIFQHTIQNPICADTALYGGTRSEFVRTASSARSIGVWSAECSCPVVPFTQQSKSFFGVPLCSACEALQSTGSFRLRLCLADGCVVCCVVSVYRTASDSNGHGYQ